MTTRRTGKVKSYPRKTRREKKVKVQILMTLRMSKIKTFLGSLKRPMQPF